MSKFPVILILVLTVLGGNALAQGHSFSTTPVVDALGRPVAVSTHGKVNGSNYFVDDWLPGKITTIDGKVYQKMLLKYNISTDMLTFVYSKADEPQKFAEPVKAFTLLNSKEMNFANGFPNVDGYRADSYYQVIAEGNATLLKHYGQTMKEVRDDNRAPIDGVYINKATYFIYRDKKMHRVRPGKNAIIEALADKATQINTYLVATQINFDNDDDLKKLFDYYNSL